MGGWGGDLGLVWQNLLRITRMILSARINPGRDILEFQYSGVGFGAGGEAFSGWGWGF